MLKIELEDDQMHKIALLGMESSMTKIRRKYQYVLQQHHF
ncbi:hypothetical protein Halhy_4805 [Haliscomenobacter hydrossis DSM 1100]|uniref:Uncharacterized protein n=1 Tax=Haliscomenobacter hydrossis (strain ATCC 27775 / DSM 1100 / LMG 10767 / O) TaxID=760192 RepID=F4KXX9_HALH1|nr:hypothetical protein Halhy_4805 [Haliscomenobacter hydrossis DSM 1100]